MFTALNEKVERLEKENDELKSQLRDFSKQFASFESRLDEKTNQDDSKIFEEMLGHNVCVGESALEIGYNSPVFKNVLDYLNDKVTTYNDRHISFALTSGCAVFNIDCLKFFPIFVKTGFEINATRGSFRVNGKLISSGKRAHNEKYIGDNNFHLIRKAFLKYGVRLLYNGRPIV